MSETRAHKNAHEADYKKLPRVLQQLPWVKPVWTDEHYNGDKLLVAVPVCTRSDEPDGTWHYEIEVVRIHCDEDYFALHDCCDEQWGWGFDDIDWMVKL